MLQDINRRLRDRGLPQLSSAKWNDDKLKLIRQQMPTSDIIHRAEFPNYLVNSIKHNPEIDIHDFGEALPYEITIPAVHSHLKKLHKQEPVLVNGNSHILKPAYNSVQQVVYEMLSRNPNSVFDSNIVDGMKQMNEQYVARGGLHPSELNQAFQNEEVVSSYVDDLSDYSNQLDELGEQETAR